MDKGNQRMSFGRFDNMGREQISAWARAALAEPNLVILDTETTGQWSRDGVDEITEICLIGRDGSQLINTLVRPYGSIHPRASQVSGITDHMLLDAPRFADLSQAIANLLAGRKVVIYNAGYDAPLLTASFQRCGMDLPSCDVHCAMLAYAAYRQTPGRYVGQYAWHKLTDAVAHERIVIPHKAHRAYGDCVATLELLRRMANGTPR